MNLAKRRCFISINQEYALLHYRNPQCNRLKWSACPQNCESEVKMKILLAQPCQTLCDPMHCSPADYSVHGILQVRILKWVAISFSRGSSRPRDWTQVTCIAGRIFTVWASKTTFPTAPENLLPQSQNAKENRGNLVNNCCFHLCILPSPCC